MKKNENMPFENCQYVIFTLECEKQKGDLLIKNSIKTEYIEDYKEPIIDFENNFPDDPNYSIENAIALTYIEYLRSKDVPITEKIYETVRTKIKDTLKGCKELAEKNKPNVKVNKTHMINVYDAAAENNHRPDFIHEISTEKWNKMENTQKTDENLL